MTNDGEGHTSTDARHDGEMVRLVRLPAGRRWLAWLAAGLVALLGAAIGTAGLARAATIDGAITSISTTATHTTQWDKVDFSCTWAVPDGSAPGDTFDLQLPPQLRWFGATDFDLKDPDGQVVAHAHAGADGKVVFTLTDYVLAHPDAVHGTCHFSTRYVAQTTDETVHLDFTVGDQVVRVDLPTQGPCTTGCATDRTKPSKYMWWDDGPQTVTQSAIRAPATTSVRSDVVIKDVPGPGLALDCSTLAVTIGKVLDAKGDVTAPRDDALYVPTTSCTPQGVTVTWSGVPAGEYTELRIRADVTDPTLASYTNAGTVDLDGHSTPVQDDVRHSDAGGDGDGTASPTSTTSTPSSTTTTSPTTTSSTTTSPTTSTTSTSTSPTTAPTSTAPSTSATGTGSISAPVTSGSVVSTGTGQVSAPSVSSGSALAFTGTDVLRLVTLAGVLLCAGLLATTLARRGRRH